MAVTPKNIIPSKTLESTQTTQYSTTGVTTLIDKFTATNYSGSAVTVSVNLVTFGDVPENKNLIANNVSIAAGATYNFPEIVGHVLQPSSYISTIASTASSVTLRASGREVT